MLLTTVSIVLGALIAIAIVITVENLRRPALDLQIAEPGDAYYDEREKRPANSLRAVTLDLVNKPLPRFARWMLRNAALQCRGAISFHHLDGQRIFASDMPVRFASSPAPLPMRINIGGIDGYLIDPLRLTADSRIDVYPGERTKLDVAARFDDDTECYGWSNLSFASTPQWRNPDWKLPQGRYLVRVTVSSSGEKCVGVFRLLNEGQRKDFCLEPALPSDKPQ